MTGLQTFPWWDAISVKATWGLRREGADSCATRLKNLLERLAPLHAGFRELSWVEGPMRPLLPLPQDIGDYAQLFRPQRFYDETRKRRVSDGFQFRADAALPNSRFVILSILAGHAVDHPGRQPAPNMLSIGTVVKDVRREDREIMQAMKPTLRAVIEAWEPDRAGAASYHFGCRQHEQARPAAFSRGSWMIFLPPELAHRVTPPPTASVERLAHGGSLLIASDGIFHEGNAEQCAAAEAMQTAVAAVGL